jgi:hypothetical protein
MTKQIKYPMDEVWHISYTDRSTYSYGKIESEQVMSTGHRITEQFDNEKDYLARIDELGIEILNEEY